MASMLRVIGSDGMGGVKLRCARHHGESGGTGERLTPQPRLTTQPALEAVWLLAILLLSHAARIAGSRESAIASSFTFHCWRPPHAMQGSRSRCRLPIISTGHVADVSTARC